MGQFKTSSFFNSVLARFAPRLYAARKKKKMTAFFSRFIHSGDLCFDIGAHNGLYTEVFLNLKAHVIAVEPVSSSLELLKRKFGSTHNPEIVQVGVASHPGEVEILISDRTELSSFSMEFIGYYGLKYGHQWPSSETIKLTTIAELIRNYGVPAFCKIDVEGSESSALEGLDRVIRSLSFEFNYPFREEAEKCVMQLSTLGFVSFNYSLFEDFEFQLEEWATSDQMIELIRSWPAKFLTGDIYAQGIRTS